MPYRVHLRLPDARAVRAVLWWIKIHNRHAEAKRHAVIEVAGREWNPGGRGLMFAFGVIVGVLLTLAIEHWRVGMEGIGNLILWWRRR